MPDLHEPDTVLASRQKREGQEVTSFGFEKSLRRIHQRDAGQKFAIRWIAIGFGVAVMLFMTFILAHHLFFRPLLPIHASFSWVVIVVPATSLTVIATALLIAAFRRFEDKDLETARSGASAASEMLGGG